MGDLSYYDKAGLSSPGLINSSIKFLVNTETINIAYRGSAVCLTHLPKETIKRLFKTNFRRDETAVFPLNTEKKEGNNYIVVTKGLSEMAQCCPSANKLEMPVKTLQKHFGLPQNGNVQ